MNITNILGIPSEIGMGRDFYPHNRPESKGGSAPKNERTVTMSRINQIAPETATDRARTLLDAVQNRLGLVPNMMRAMANSPAVLDAYLQFSGALSKGTLSARVREQLSLAVAQANGCDYCLAAHSTIGKMVGLTAERIRDSRLGTAVDPKTDALIRFALEVVEARGRVSDAALADVHEAGFDDGAIAEVVAHVALDVFTNYFNNVARTDVDFPNAPELAREPAGA
jgi:uncharacterized peroxidase-related enzyme